MWAHMDINGALLVPERQKQGVWVHGYVQDARNLPFALNADALQELRALLVSCIYFAAPAHIQSCITEMFRVRSVPGADIGRGLCMLYARTTAALTPHSVTHQQAGCSPSLSMLIVSLFSFLLLTRAGGTDGGLPAQTLTALQCTCVRGLVAIPLRPTLGCAAEC